MLMMKKVLSVLLCAALLFGCLNVGFVSVGASASAAEAITALAKKFPNGKYWNHVGSETNNPDGYTSTACTHHYSSGCDLFPGSCECNSFLNAIQCRGFAFKSAYDLVGTNPRNWSKTTSLNLSSLCVGDIIRYFDDNHSITVIGVSGDTIAFVGANWGGNCLIKWGTIKRYEIKGFEYVLHDTGNKMKNSDVNIYSKVAGGSVGNPPETDYQNCEVWKMSAKNSLNIRAAASVSSAAVGTVPAGGTFGVTKKTDSDGYLWGYVNYAGVKGWAALNYAGYVSGSYDRPDIISAPGTVKSGTGFRLRFSPVSGAESYTVSFYGSDEKLYLDKTVKSCSDTFVIKDAGKYKVTVTAKNSKVSSWKAVGEPISLTVTAAYSSGDKIPVYGDSGKSVETWRMNNDGNLNVRNAASTGAAVVGSIPKGEAFKVGAKTVSGGYLWGYINYGSVKGWAVLNYPEYVSGYYERPNIKYISRAVYEGRTFEVDFSPVSGAESYNVLIYDSASKLCLNKNVKGCSAELVLNKTGTYTVRIVALNSKAPTWKICSVPYTFAVESDSVENGKISLPSKLGLAKGSVYTLKPVVTGTAAEDGLVYSGGNPNTATVSKDGKITAVGYGTVRIYCESKKHPSVKAYCDVSVIPPAVRNVRQLTNKTNSTSAVLTWDKVPGATGYLIYSCSSGTKLIGKTAGNSFRITNLKSNTSQKTVVRSYVASGGKNYVSAASAVCNVLTSPAAVTGVRVTDIKTDSSVLRWNKAAGADLYAVYRYVKGKGYVYVGATRNNSYIVKGRAGTVYRFMVRAVNAVGSAKLYSDYSDSAYLIFKPAKTKLSASPGKDCAVLKWNKVTGASGYQVYVYTSKGYKRLKGLNASTNQYKVTGLKRKTNYKFLVRAYTKAGSTVSYADSVTVTIKTK